MVDFDPHQRVLRVDGRAVELSPQQARIFAVLWEHRPDFVPVAQIAERVFPADRSPPARPLDLVKVVLCHIRQRLEEAGVTARVKIRTRYRLGYAVEVAHA